MYVQMKILLFHVLMYIRKDGCSFMCYCMLENIALESYYCPCLLESYLMLLLDAYARYKYDMTVEEAGELARRAIYHATYRDGASGGVVSGTLSFSLFLKLPVLFVFQD